MAAVEQSDIPSTVIVDDTAPLGVEVESLHQSRAQERLLGRVVQKPESVTSEESSMTSGSVYTTSGETGEEDADEEETSTDAEELLAFANIRLQQQKLLNEVKQLREIVSQKDEQVMQLTVQLRRATASKCDLVLACTEMERLKEEAEKYGSEEAREVKKGYLAVLEARADVEREFMNELATLSNVMDDMDRRYKNQLLEKDFMIAQLEEKLLRLGQK